MYQWLLRRNGFQVAKTGYFIYCNGDDSKEEFGGKLEFSTSMLPYKGDDSWVDSTLLAIRNCLSTNKMPEAQATCAFCQYRAVAHRHLDDKKTSVPATISLFRESSMQSASFDQTLQNFIRSIESGEGSATDVTTVDAQAQALDCLMAADEVLCRPRYCPKGIASPSRVFCIFPRGTVFHHLVRQST